MESLKTVRKIMDAKTEIRRRVKLKLEGPSLNLKIKTAENPPVKDPKIPVIAPAKICLMFGLK